MSIQTPFVTPFASIRDFGAVPNDPGSLVRHANSEAFKQAQAAMQSPGQAWGHPLFVPSGTYYLADDLHIRKSLDLFGTGLQGESILMFPKIFKITDEALACLTAAGVPDEIVGKLKPILDREFLEEELMQASGDLIGNDVAAANWDQILKCALFRGTSLIIDRGDGADPTIDGSECVIHDLQIISEEEWVIDMATPFTAGNFDPPVLEGTSKGTPGILMGTTATVQRVYIKGFSGTGIRVKKIAPANANQWRIHDVYIESCGGHGIHIGGHGVEDADKSETQGGLCSGAKIFTVDGNGIYDGSFGGNTFVGCYVEETKGRGYSSEAPGQVAFIGCMAEAMEPNRLAVGGSVWVGGSPGKGFTDDTVAFIAESYGNVYPFEVPNQASNSMRPEDQLKKFGRTFQPVTLKVGFPNDLSDPTTLYVWKYSDHGYVMRWDEGNHAWTVEDANVLPVPEKPDGSKWFHLREPLYRHIATYLTGPNHPRGPWLQGFSELLLGPVDNPIKISRGDKPADDDPGEPGDIIYIRNPDDYIGYVYIDPVRKWKPFGKIEI